jgi:hypothetical protein
MVVVGGALEGVVQGLGLTVLASAGLYSALWMRSNPLWVRDSFWRSHASLRNWLRNPFPWPRPVDLPGEHQERRRATGMAIYCCALIILGLVLITRSLL